MTNKRLKSWREHYWNTIPVMRTRIETITNLVQPAGKRILEVGCNEGFLSRALEEAGGTVKALDIDPEMVLKAKEIFGIDAHVGDINYLNEPENFYDVVVGGEILEHIENPFKGLKEMFSVAKSQVIISLPIGAYWLGERTHQWELGASIMQHDTDFAYVPLKDILVLSWTRRRTPELEDIPPFNTQQHKKEFNI